MPVTAVAQPARNGPTRRQLASGSGRADGAAGVDGVAARALVDIASSAAASESLGVDTRVPPSRASPQQARPYGRACGHPSGSASDPTAAARATQLKPPAQVAT